MSESFSFPPVPAERARHVARRARHVARLYKAMAEHMADAGLAAEAARSERQSAWWLNYSIALAVNPPADGEA
jgi:hypothetical protein